MSQLLLSLSLCLRGYYGILVRLEQFRSDIAWTNCSSQLSVSQCFEPSFALLLEVLEVLLLLTVDTDDYSIAFAQYST